MDIEATAVCSPPWYFQDTNIICQTNLYTPELQEIVVFACFVQCSIPALRVVWHIVGAHNYLLNKPGNRNGKSFEGQDQL